MNIEDARSNMLKQQIHAWDVLDEQVLHVLATTPREQFVPDAYVSMAFGDIAIPVSYTHLTLPTILLV